MATKPAAPLLPKFDMNTALAAQKANVDALLQADRIASETAQAVVKLQADWLKELGERTRALATASVTRKPEAVLADARGAAERAFAVARQGLDLGFRAQGEVVDLLTKRAAANLDGLKAYGAKVAA